MTMSVHHLRMNTKARNVIEFSSALPARLTTHHETTDMLIPIQSVDHEPYKEPQGIIAMSRRDQVRWPDDTTREMSNRKTVCHHQDLLEAFDDRLRSPD